MFYKIVGAVFLIFSRIKYLLLGYTSPKPLSIDDCIAYDNKTVNLWLFYLALYTEKENYLADKNVLELGPGTGIGEGLRLLSKGAFRYNAVDVNRLVDDVPDFFYDRFLEYLKKSDENVDIEYLRREVEKYAGDRGDKLNYICREDFDLVSPFGEETIDIVFSFAAFEHFDDVEETARQLSVICRPGAVLIAQIDLQTHTRWIRHIDPNNIYRFGESFYKFVHFRGIPNRVRPFRYKEIFTKWGWQNVKTAPLTHIRDKNKKIKLNIQFEDDCNQMDCLSIMLCARKS